MDRRRFFFVSLSAAAPLGAGAAPPIDLARAAATDWLLLVDSGDLDASWTQAASMFRQAVTGPQWAEAARRVRAPLGAVRQRREKSAQATRALPGAPDGNYVLLQFEVSFERKAAAVETVTLVLDSDERWRVTGYFIK